MTDILIRKLKAKLLASKGACTYCGTQLTEADATVDHVVPIAAGGHTTRENVVLSCIACNQEKGSRFPTREEVQSLFDEEAFLPPTIKKRLRHPKRGGHSTVQTAGTPLAVLLGLHAEMEGKECDAK